jgi:radical SAM superfamily enzyme YgiQ (UPF0313 family)
MKLELVVPATKENIQHRKKAIFPPLGMATIAAITPSDIDVMLTDENVSPIDFNKKADLVGITALTYTAPRAYEIANAFRVRGIKVVMGGIHPSVLPQEALQHADAVVIGEAEKIWSNVIKDFKARKLQKIYRNTDLQSLEGLPNPRRDLYAKGVYHFKNTIWATRGCPHSCSFCSVSSVFGRKYRCRPVDDVINEVANFGKGSNIIFTDDNIAGNFRYAKELFRRLIPLKVKWASQASVTIAKDKDLLKLAADSGCIDLAIGFESLSPTSLEMVGKKINIVDKYENVIRNIHDHGIAIHAFFLFGLDGDSEDIFERTLRFAQRTKIETAQFAWPVPYPGTALFKEMDKAGRISTKDWKHYESSLVFEPKLMSRETLSQKRSWVWREFYSLPSIWKRLGMLRSRCQLYFWATNLYYRSFWRRKHYEIRKGY